MSEKKEWRAPAPNIEVIDALHRAYVAALRGDVRVVVMVTVNPLQQKETAISGDLSSVNRDVLVGGLSATIYEIHRYAEAQNGETNSNNSPG